MQRVARLNPQAEYEAHDVSRPRAVYVVDEDAMTRRGTFLYLADRSFAPHPFKTAQDFIDNLEHLQPGCLLLGNLGGEPGALRLIEALGDRIVEFPVVITASHGDVATAVQAMKLGASDVLELPFGRDVLPAMLESILAALAQRLGKVRSVRAARSLVQALSAREGEVLRHLLRGASNKEIARHLDLSLRTVEMHRARMMVRLQVSHLSDAVRIAFDAGMPNT